MRRKSPPDRWLALSVPAPPRGEEPFLVEALRRLGARLVDREGERFVAHLPVRKGGGPSGDPAALLEEARGVIRASTSLEDPDLAWSWSGPEEVNARWGRELRPRRVGLRILVVPAGREGEVPPGPDDVVVRLEPGVAFGTAEHATTRSCLRCLERLVARGDRIADVGAGSGILSVAAAGLGARRVLALEADPDACRTAAANVALNRAGRRVRIRERRVRTGDLPRLGRFRGIVANLEAGAALPLLPDFARALRKGGWIVVSGIARAERPAVLRAARAVGLEPEVEDVEEGWWTGVLRRAEGPPAERR